MSLLEDLHTERKARLVRLGAIPSKVPVAKVPVINVAEYVDRLRELEKKLEHKESVIRELHLTVRRQREVICKYADESEIPTPRMNDIIHTVAEFYNISKAMLVGDERTKALVLARQVVYFLGRKNGYSLHQIGRSCDKDHTTALYGANKVEGLVARNYLNLASRVAEIETRLHTFVLSRVEQLKAAALTENVGTVSINKDVPHELPIIDSQVICEAQ